MNNNFFKKHLVVIIISLFLIATIWFYKVKNTKSLPPSHLEPKSQNAIISPEEEKKDKIYEIKNLEVINKKQNEIENKLLKEKIRIQLPDSLDPNEAISKYKRDNNLYNYDGKYIKNKTKEEDKIYCMEFSYSWLSILNAFETENKIYYIICTEFKPKADLLMNYINKMCDWAKQCYIRKGFSYSDKDIRNKFGRSSRDIYDEEGNIKRYYYETGWIIDDWYINGVECKGDYNSFSHYYDITKPPEKPKELDLKITFNY
jgi:hypothetical protein